MEIFGTLESGAAPSHLRHLDNLQTRIERTCCSTFEYLLHHRHATTFEYLLHRRHATIIGFICCLLAGERQGNLQNFCLMFRGAADICHRSSRLHSWDPADYLRFIDPCNFWTLDRFRSSWQVSAVHLWNSLPACTEYWKFMIMEPSCSVSANPTLNSSG